MNEELAKHGLYFDYLYNLRVLDPNIASDTSDLKEKSGDYIESKLKSYTFIHDLLHFIFIFNCWFTSFLNGSTELQEFRKIIDEFIGIAETIVSDVEQEKNQAIAAQNLLKSMAKQREADQQDIQVNSIDYFTVFLIVFLILNDFLQNEIHEKTMELEQLKVQLQYLQRIEANQQELIENFYENQ